jgi:transcriptional regulator with XRE-family HTH domain
MRETRGFSQEDFAVRVGIHRTYIGGIERGERNPTVTTVEKIAHALGVPVSSLFERMEKRK